MINLLENFSNREIAFYSWIFIFAIFIVLYKPTRKSFYQVIKAFFVDSILMISLSFIAYILASIILLQKLEFWDVSLLKDTILWVFGYAFILLFGVTKMTRKNDFLDVLKGSVKWTIIVEFLVAFYTFSITVEFILLPVLTFIALIQAYSDTKQEYLQVGNVINGILTLVGFLVLGYVFYKTFFDRGELISLSNFKSFILPLILTCFIIPFLYIVSVYAVYESLFVRLEFVINEKEYKRKLKIQIFQVAKLNLNKISNISQNIAKDLMNKKEFSIIELRELARQKLLR